MWTTRVHNLSNRQRSLIEGSDFPGPGARTWRPRPALIVAGAVATLAALTWVVLDNSAEDRVMGGIVVLALAIVTLLGWRRRLIAGPRGLLVCGLTGIRIVPWSDVRSVQSAISSRFGLSTTTVEVDMHDDDLLVFGRTDLGADPADVLAALRVWWTG